MDVTRPQFPNPAAAPLPAHRPSSPSTARDAATPAGSPAPPESTLWDLLTPAERDFFTQQAALGPLRYAPQGSRSEAPAGPTGQRLDVKA